MSQLLREMPKAELHIRIEGSLEPELIIALADRNGVKLPYANVEALRNQWLHSLHFMQDTPHSCLTLV